MTTSISANATFPPQQLVFPGLPQSGNLMITSSGPCAATIFSGSGSVVATVSSQNAITAGPFAYSGGIAYAVVSTPSRITLTA